MTLAKYLKIAVLGIKGEKDKGKATRKVFECVSDDDEYKDACISKETTTYRKYYNGNREPDNVLCGLILQKLDKTKFIKLFEEFANELKYTIIEKLSKELNININNFEDVMTETFNAIIFDIYWDNNEKGFIRDRRFKEIEKQMLKSAVNKIDKIIKYDNRIGIKYNPVNVAKKLKDDNKALIKKIKSDVSKYYTMINKEIKKVERLKSIDSDLAREVIRAEYKLLKGKSLDDEKVIDVMTIWLSRELDTSIGISQKLIYYFIQSCEVFDDISK